jgi:cytoskeleton-associated protein 5
LFLQAILLKSNSLMTIIKFSFHILRTTNDVMNGIITKCIAAPKVKTKDLAVQIILMYIEIEKQEAVQDELMKGTEAKNPKIVSACITTLALALR